MGYSRGDSITTFNWSSYVVPILNMSIDYQDHSSRDSSWTSDVLSYPMQAPASQHTKIATHLIRGSQDWLTGHIVPCALNTSMIQGNNPAGTYPSRMDAGQSSSNYCIHIKTLNQRHTDHNDQGGLSSFNETRVQDGRCSPQTPMPMSTPALRSLQDQPKKPRLFLSLQSDVCGGDATSGGGRGAVLLTRDRCDHKVAASQFLVRLGIGAFQNGNEAGCPVYQERKRRREIPPETIVTLQKLVFLLVPSCLSNAPNSDFVTVGFLPTLSQIRCYRRLRLHSELAVVFAGIRRT
jgi:hypothetical protein